MACRKKQSLVLTAALLVTSQVLAWQEGTHRLVNSLAYKQLSPASLEFVESLLGQPPALRWLNLDEAFYQRRLNPSANWERALDYNWMPKSDSEFDPSKHCAKRDCLVAGILSSYQVLQDQARSRAEHQRALQFFVVLTARLHQPLNTGFPEDEGGRLVVLPSANTDVNLRWIWEQGLYQQAGGNWQMMSAEWPAAKDMPEFDGMNALDWLAESRELAIEQVYLPALGADWPAIASTYDDVWQQQINLAAMRIAESINTIFASSEPDPESDSDSE